MRKAYVLLATSALAGTVFLSGCSATNQQLGTGIGAVAGGVVGDALFGSTLGTVGGAAAGALIGNHLGQDIHDPR